MSVCSSLRLAVFTHLLFSLPVITDPHFRGKLKLVDNKTFCLLFQTSVVTLTFVLLPVVKLVRQFSRDNKLQTHCKVGSGSSKKSVKFNDKQQNASQYSTVVLTVVRVMIAKYRKSGIWFTVAP